MTRKLLPRGLRSLLGALLFVSCGLFTLHARAQVAQPKQAAVQSQALVGTWSATVNWNLPSGLMITTSFAADGRIQSTVQNHQGMSFTLMGTYEFNAAHSTLSYKWQDFLPKQTCVLGACTPAQPPAPMGVVTNNQIRILSATQFVATSNGASTTYIRTNAAGFPTP